MFEQGPRKALAALLRRNTKIIDPRCPSKPAIAEATIWPSSSPTRNNSGWTRSLRWMSSTGLFQGRIRPQACHKAITAASSPGRKERINMKIPRNAVKEESQNRRAPQRPEDLARTRLYGPGMYSTRPPSAWAWRLAEAQDSGGAWRSGGALSRQTRHIPGGGRRSGGTPCRR